MTKKRSKHLPRIAASSYANTAPLIWSFLHGSQRDAANLITDTAPARCAEMLFQGEADAALVPVIEYQRAKDAEIVAGVCVGSRKQVRSVILVTAGQELKQIRSIALDSSSRTSSVLIEVIFKEFVGQAPVLLSHEPNLQAMLKVCDAALLIGDPAMTCARSGLKTFDLAQLWYEFTGLGFVFAVWMTMRSASENLRDVSFAAARDEGLAKIDEIAAMCAPGLALKQSEVADYLRSNICFTLDQKLMDGLRLYFELAQKHGAIEKAGPIVISADVS
jgi:chorismate dehydratase